MQSRWYSFSDTLHICKDSRSVISCRHLRIAPGTYLGIFYLGELGSSGILTNKVFHCHCHHITICTKQQSAGVYFHYLKTFSSCLWQFYRSLCRSWLWFPEPGTPACYAPLTSLLQWRHHVTNSCRKRIENYIHEKHDNSCVTWVVSVCNSFVD